MINIVKIADWDPNSDFLSPRGRAASLGYAGVDYLTACIFTQEHHQQIGPLWNFRLPTMHQTLELLTKAVAFLVDDEFKPTHYSHHVKKLMQDYEKHAPIFAMILAYPDTIELLDGLEKSYFGVRYGECGVNYDGDAWLLFRRIADDLLNDLRHRTNLRFPY